jgi:hypothetical protein
MIAVISVLLLIVFDSMEGIRGAATAGLPPTKRAPPLKPNSMTAASLLLKRGKSRQNKQSPPDKSLEMKIKTSPARLQAANAPKERQKTCILPPPTRVSNHKLKHPQRASRQPIPPRNSRKPQFMSIPWDTSVAFQGT